jgi:hypothetical protein
MILRLMHTCAFLLKIRMLLRRMRGQFSCGEGNRDRCLSVVLAHPQAPGPALVPFEMDNVRVARALYV